LFTLIQLMFKYIRVFRIPAIHNHDAVKLNYSPFQILTEGFNALQ